MLASELNAYDILCNQWIVFTRETLPGGLITEGAVSGSPAVATSEPPAQADGPDQEEEPSDG
jgi:hypothetical protein